MSEIKTDICSPDNNNNNTLDTSEDHQTSPTHISTQSRTNGNNLLSNPTVDQLIPRLVDFIRKQNTIDLNLIANQVFK